MDGACISFPRALAPGRHRLLIKNIHYVVLRALTSAHIRAHRIIRSSPSLQRTRAALFRGPTRFGVLELHGSFLRRLPASCLSPGAAAADARALNAHAVDSCAGEAGKAYGRTVMRGGCVWSVLLQGLLHRAGGVGAGPVGAAAPRRVLNCICNKRAKFVRAHATQPR